MKQKYFIALLILTTMIGCTHTKDNSIIENLSLLFFRKDRVTISGTAVKGVLKKAEVNIHKLKPDGTCDTSSNLGTALTDENGNYSIFYNQGNGVVCVRILASKTNNTRVFDEKTKADLPITSSDFNITNTFSEDKLINSSRSNVSISPFSKMISRRLANLMQASGGKQTPSSLNQRASKEVVIRFGLNSGLSSISSRNINSVKNTSTPINGSSYPELIDLNVDYRDLNDPFTAKSIAILSGFSQLANQFKTGTSVSSNDIDSIIESFAKDFEDGVFDGKDGSGKQITIGTGSKEILMPADSITNLMLPAIRTFFAEGGVLNVGQNYIATASNPPVTIPSTALSQIQFLDSVPIIFTDADTFSIGGTVSDLYTTGLVLQNNAGEEITVSHSVGLPRTFTFNTKVKTYAVTIKTQPLASTCTVLNGTGTASADVTNVSVSCLTYVGNGVLKPLNNLTNTVSTFAGHPTNGFANPGTTDGIGTAARFQEPTGVTTDGINIYLTEGQYNRIRKIVIATGQVTTIATPAVNPQGLTIVGSNLYTTGYGSNRIHRIDITTNAVSVFSGDGTNAFLDGPAGSARFQQPDGGLTTDGKDLYYADPYARRIRKIEIPSGFVSTLAGNGTSAFVDGTGAGAQFTTPRGLTTDGTNLFVADDCRIRRIVISTGVVTTIAGNTPAYADGTGSAASFASNNFGMVTDGLNLYIASTGHHSVRRVVIGTGVVTTIAGNAPPTPTSGEVDGIGNVSRFNAFRHLTSDGISLFITDHNNNKVRRLQ
ncbi:MAG: hypothetical protein SFU98_02220 [Leptospiraceae bacterium]|nr:hypothetical protein [Leptospiraceae bacterium]